MRSNAAAFTGSAARVIAAASRIRSEWHIPPASRNPAQREQSQGSPPSALQLPPGQLCLHAISIARI
jgi:hypothetical protein